MEPQRNPTTIQITTMKDICVRLFKRFVLLSIGYAAFGVGNPVMAASPAGDVVGKITVGYQGWFACTGDGSPINSWWHWSGTFDPPTPDTLTNKVHAWPD